MFLAGEWQFSRLYATSFARYHRLTAATYKHVELQYVAGLARLMAEYNGLTHAPRIQDQLAWLAQYAEGGSGASEHITLQTIPGAGHFPAFEQRDVWKDAIEDFLP